MFFSATTKITCGLRIEQKIKLLPNALCDHPPMWLVRKDILPANGKMYQHLAGGWFSFPTLEALARGSFYNTCCTSYFFSNQ
jgi:hypothetical protein